MGGEKIHTPNNLKYEFFPVDYSAINIKVKAGNDAHIALASKASDEKPIVELLIGGYNEGQTPLTTITRNGKYDIKAYKETPSVLSKYEEKEFWLSWKDGNIKFGKAGEAKEIISWQDPHPFHVSYIGICTGFGSEGDWTLEPIREPVHKPVPKPQPKPPFVAPPPDPVSSTKPEPEPAPEPGWELVKNKVIPSDALLTGYDNGTEVYVGRAKYEGDLIPGKVHKDHGVCYIAWGGLEHAVSEYEVIKQDSKLKWVAAKNGNVPENAVVGGKTKGGEKLYIGRVQFRNVGTSQVNTSVGKIQTSSRVCFIPFNGKEIAFEEYEVLIKS